MADHVSERLSSVEVERDLDARTAVLFERAAREQERIIVTRGGTPWAAIVPIEDALWLEAIEDRVDEEAYRQAKEEFERSGMITIPWSKLMADAGM